MKRFAFILIGLLLLFIGCEKNHAPVINEIVQNPASFGAGTIYSLEVKASDEDGDILQYSWTANGGKFIASTNTNEVQWESPVSGEGESFSIFVSVTDGEYEVSKELTIELTEPVFGAIRGHVYFINCEIPISGVRIQIAGKETFTERDGSYVILDLISRKDTLRINKEDFSSKESIVSIPPNVFLNYNIEMLSVIHSSKCFGVITDQDGQPINQAQVIVLNPNGTDSNLKDVTDERGLFRIPYVPHGLRPIVVRKATNDEFIYRELRKGITFTDIEQECNFIVLTTPLNGQFTDGRDNREYNYKIIGDQTWMVANLQYLPEVSPSTERSEEIAHYYVYGFQGTDVDSATSEINYDDYGVLYNWQAAMKACPYGWHLPSRWEWNTLFGTLGSDQAYKMKTTAGWANNGNGDNSSGFSALPAGVIGNLGNFIKLSEATYFSTSTVNDDNLSDHIYFQYDLDYPRIFQATKMIGLSVRCVKND